MTDKTTATLRTAMPAAWASVMLWMIDTFGLNLSEQEWHVLLVLAPIVTGIFYRLAREVEGRWPVVGRVLFGSTRQPHYEESTGSD